MQIKQVRVFSLVSRLQSDSIAFFLSCKGDAVIDQFLAYLAVPVFFTNYQFWNIHLKINIIKSR